MAATEYGVNAPEAVKLWSRKLMQEALKQTWASKFMGRDSGSLVQVLDDTSKGPGDSIKCILRMQLTGDGIQGDDTLEGNEENLATHTDNLLIDQLRHAVRSKGKMTEQRIPFAIREEARMGLQDWWAARFDTWFMNQLSGNSAVTDTRYTGNQAATAPTSANAIYANGHASEATMTATASAQFSLGLIDAAVLKATTLTPPIRPLSGGKYVMFVTPEHRYDMRRNSSSMEWADIQKAALTANAAANNPIYTMALGEYNNVVLHESYRVPVITSSGGSKIGRAIFCGAQAGILAFGRGFSTNRMDWTEELFDYKNSLGVEAGCIAGLKKTVYNSKDFATITVSAAHSANAVTATGRP
jgi:N4-gp56 family major capsid protein